MPLGNRILAAGFNAHGQLDPTSKPDNIHTFKEVASDFGKTEAVKSALWSSTVIASSSSGMKHLGISGKSYHNQIELQDAPENAAFFGDISGIKGYFIPSSAAIYILQHNGTFQQHHFPPSHPVQTRKLVITHLAIAGNEKCCIAVNPYSPKEDAPHQTHNAELHIYRALSNFLQGSQPDQLHPMQGTMTSLTATSTTFTILTHFSRVLTFGDARYPALLGRTPSPDEPAGDPHVVSALDGLPIQEVVAGSWMVAALSHEKDLYFWGHVLPRSPTIKDHAGFSALLNGAAEGEEVHLIDVADGADIEGMAVGEKHVVILTTEGEVWGLGSNEYGQLGLGQEIQGTGGHWRRIQVVGEREKVMGMKAGPFATFLVVVKDDLP
ncbi:MAG: hypothetical protein Q9219_006758 [cf. Caloplaca sp. 3 TL-2023]